MRVNPKVSLCIPTNGVIEWLFPVLDSIIRQNVDENLYEIVITDNGNNYAFKEKIKEYIKDFNNITYIETNALPFLNEIEAYKNAKGDLIKFINHRTLLEEGTLKYLVDFSEANYKEKPIVYFSNGVLNIPKDQNRYNSFDLFVRNLSYYSSWSTGMAIWKEDFEIIRDNVIIYNELFPHMDILFYVKNRENYIIDNRVILKEMDQGKRPKGNYDLFFAFGVEYPSIILDLLRDRKISVETFKSVLDDNLDFISSMYIDYVLLKKYCSYDLSGKNLICEVFYSKFHFLRKIIKNILIKGIKKITKR